MKMIITIFVLVAGITAQSAINQKATNSNCIARTSGNLHQNTNPQKQEQIKPVKMDHTQQASSKGRAQGS